MKYAIPLLLFFLSGCFYKTPDLREKVVVKVNEHELTSQQFGQFLAKRLKDLDSISAKNPDIIEKNKSLVTEAFITDSLITDYCKEKNITVSEQELNQEIDRTRKIYPDDSAFRKELAFQNLSYDQWKKDTYTHLLQKKFFTYLGKGVTPPTAEEIREYYEAHKQRFATTEQILIRQVVLPNEAQAERIKNLLKKESFDSLAKQYSITPEKEKGGLVGWIEKDAVDVFAPFFNLPLNRVSGPFETPYGFHIVRIEGKRKESYKPFERVKDQLRNELLNDRHQGLFINWLSGQTKASAVFIDKELIKAVSVVTRKD